MRASPLDGSGGGRRASGKSRTISAAGLRAVRGAGLGWLPWLANLGGGERESVAQLALNCWIFSASPSLADLLLCNHSTVFPAVRISTASLAGSTGNGRFTGWYPRFSRAELFSSWDVKPVCLGCSSRGNNLPVPVPSRARVHRGSSSQSL